MKFFFSFIILSFFILQNPLSATETPHVFDGFYMGASSSREFKKVKAKTMGVSTNFANFKVDNNTHLSMNGATGSLFVGYGKTFSGMYIGSEIGGEISNGRAKHTSNFLNGVNDTHSIDGRKSRSFLLTARIGKQLQEKYLIYVKGGIALSDYNFSFALDSDVNGVSLNKTKNKKIVHPVMTAGIEYLANDLFKDNDFLKGQEIRAAIEYDHLFKKTISIDHSTDDFQGKTNFGLSAETVKMRLIFKL